MKYRLLYIFLAMAGGLALTACSSTEDASSEENASIATAEDITKGMSNSDREILLSTVNASNVTQTRACLGDDNGNFEVDETTGLGIFMLARQATSGNELLKVNWSGTGSIDVPGTGNTVSKAYADTWSVPADMQNVKCHTSIDNDASGSPVTNIRWNDGLCRYYPMGNYHVYTFYGYYPYVESTSIQREAEQISVTYSSMNGTTDYIWGRGGYDDLTSADTHRDEAYCAKYFREPENMDATGNAIPAKMTFHHLMSRFTFKVVAGGLTKAGSSEKDYTKAKKVTIKKLEIVDVAKTGVLVVAKKGYPSEEGVMTFPDKRSMENSFTLYNDDDVTQSSISMKNTFDGSTPKETDFGYGIMLPPIKSTDDPYRMQMTIWSDEDGDGVQDSNEPDQSYSVPLALTLQDGKEMTAGESYNFLLTIYGPEQVALKATLEPWVSKDASSVFVTESGTVPVE